MSRQPRPGPRVPRMTGRRVPRAAKHYSCGTNPMQKREGTGCLGGNRPHSDAVVAVNISGSNPLPWGGAIRLVGSGPRAERIPILRAAETGSRNGDDEVDARKGAASIRSENGQRNIKRKKVPIQDGLGALHLRCKGATCADDSRRSGSSLVGRRVAISQWGAVDRQRRSQPSLHRIAGGTN